MLSKNSEKQISLLPIYKEKDSIISLLKSQKSNIIIIMGETGSGKTTQVPKIIYKNLPLNNMYNSTKKSSSNINESFRRIKITNWKFSWL